MSLATLITFMSAAGFITLPPSPPTTEDGLRKKEDPTISVEGGGREGEREFSEE